MKTASISTANKRAVIYCRVSTGRQVEEGGSLSSQERICKEYALKNGLDVVQSFIEEGESAKTANRTALKELLTFCTKKENQIGTVIFYKIDRFSRYTEDYNFIRHTLRQKKITIRSATEVFDDTPAGRFMENMLITVAQFDNDVRTERCTGGMRDAMREGRYVWGAPPGYDNVRINGKANIAPNQQSKFIYKAFHEVAKNMFPVDEIRRKLTKKGLTNRSGRLLTKGQFYRLLRNETYAGWIVKFGERHRGLFEPLITEELFQQVQLALRYRKRKNLHYEKENPSFPLRRFVQHSEGSKLTGCWSQGRRQKYPYYRFLSPKMNIRKEELERGFLQFWNGFQLDNKHYDAFFEAVKVHLDFATKDQEKERVILQKTLSALKERQNALIQKNLNGVISDTVLRQQLEIVDNELLQAGAALESLPEGRAEYGKLIEFVKEFLKNPCKIWMNAPFPLKLKLQWFAFPKGIIFDGTNFRTTEIARIFKDKSDFLATKLHDVKLKHKSTNTPKLTNEESWEKIGKEINALASILSCPKSREGE